MPRSRRTQKANRRNARVQKTKAGHDAKSKRQLQRDLEVLTGAPRRPSSTQEQTSRLLGLAPELRNQIYQYVFSSRAEREIVVEDNESANPAFLRTCKQIYIEARGVHHHQAMFQTTDIGSVGALLRAMSSKQRAALQRVRIACPPNAPQTHSLRLVRRTLLSFRHVYGGHKRGLADGVVEMELPYCDLAGVEGRAWVSSLTDLSTRGDYRSDEASKSTTYIG